MTKIIKWWHKISFWNKLQGTLLSVGIGSEATLFFMDSIDAWKWVAGTATILGMLITKWFEDKNKDGIADIFQKDK